MKPEILVPFDFSETAERALAWAADLQRTTGAPRLHLVHAIPSRPAGTMDVPLAELLPSAEELAVLESSLIDKARGHRASATAAVCIRAATVEDIILEAADTAGAELIVMGSHGRRTGVRRLLLGSVAEHVLRHAKVSRRDGAETRLRDALRARGRAISCAALAVRAKISRRDCRARDARHVRSLSAWSSPVAAERGLLRESTGWRIQARSPPTRTPATEDTHVANPGTASLLSRSNCRSQDPPGLDPSGSSSRQHGVAR